MANFDSLKKALGEKFSRVNEQTCQEVDNLIVQYELLRWCGPHPTVDENVSLLLEICQDQGFVATPLNPAISRNWLVYPPGQGAVPEPRP